MLTTVHICKTMCSMGICTQLAAIPRDLPKQGTCLITIACVRAHLSFLWVQVKKDFQELVLSARQDDFYRKHMYNNFGDIGTAVKDLVDEFQRHSAKGQSMNTLEEMQSFVENYSEFSMAQKNASKHVTLISTLSSLVDSRTLMQVQPSCQENLIFVHIVDSA